MLVLAALSLRAAPPPKHPELVPPLRGQAMAEALLARAEKEGIRWQDNVTPAFEAQPKVGDAIVVLVGACDGEITRQWLLQLKRVPTRSEDKSAEDHQITLFSCWGPVSIFNADPEPLEVTVIGPVQVKPSPRSGKEPKVELSRTRVLVPGAFMRLGLDGTARSCIRLMEATRRLVKEEPGFKPVNLWSRTSPVPSEQLRLYKPIAARLGRTPEDERLFVGGLVSLQSFYEIAKSDPVLRDIAMTVINRPSAWALAKSAFGAGPNTQFFLNDGLCPLKASDAGIVEPGFEIFQVPFEMSLQGTSLVNCFMAVTRPVPPLDVSAGILALVAIHPKDTTRVIELKLLGFGL